MAYGSKLIDFKLPHDIVFICAKRMTNRRAAGDRYSYSIQISYSTTKDFDILSASAARHIRVH